MDDIRDEAAGFDELAAVVEQRAERVLRHAVRARQQAEEHASAIPIHEIYLREARAHEQSAALLKRTAGLYRQRARELKPTNAVPDGPSARRRDAVEVPGWPGSATT